VARITIPVEQLPAPDKNGNHNIQFRVISEDRNKASAWSTLYTIKSIGQYRPLQSDVDFILSDSDVSVIWDTPTIYNASQDFILYDVTNVGSGSASFTSVSGYAFGKLIFVDEPNRTLIPGDQFYINTVAFIQGILFTVKSTSYTLVDSVPRFTVSVTSDISNLSTLQTWADYADVETFGTGWFNVARDIYFVNQAKSASIAHNHSIRFKKHPTDIFVKWDSSNFEYHERTDQDAISISIPETASASVRVIGTVATHGFDRNTISDQIVEDLSNLFLIFDTGTQLI